MTVSSSDRVQEGRVVERQTSRPVFFGPGMMLGVLGAAGVIVSLFLPWRESGVHPSDIPVSFLWDRTATSSLSLLILLVPIAIVLVIGAFVPMGAGVRLFGALGALIVAGLFTYQLNRTVDAFGGSLGDVLDIGFYLAAIGGIVAFVSGLIPSGWRTRREVTQSDPRDSTLA